MGLFGRCIHVTGGLVTAMIIFALIVESLRLKELNTQVKAKIYSFSYWGLVDHCLFVDPIVVQMFLWVFFIHKLT